MHTQNSLQILIKYNVTYANSTEILSYRAQSRQTASTMEAGYKAMINKQCLRPAVKHKRSVCKMFSEKGGAENDGHENAGHVSGV